MASRLIVPAAIALALLVPAPSGAQATDPNPPNPAPDPAAQSALVEALGRLGESQQRLIEEQGRRIDELQRQLDAIRALLAAQKTASPAPPAQAEPSVTAASAPPAAPIVTVTKAQRPAEAELKRNFPELAPDLVSRGDFPGSFNIPDSDTAVKVGGMVRLNWVTTFDPLLVTDRFITSQIPVDVTNAPVGGSVDVIAIPSRVNLDFRTPTGVGYMRAFLEADFAGSGNTLRLRHAYGQWRRLLFGQTWSTFADPEADPDGIDFEGLNAVVHVRQPQARWSWAAAERLRVAIALENADAEIAGATAAPRRPDFISRIRWETMGGGHIQAAALLRHIRGFPPDSSADIVSATGWGVNVAGRLPSPFARKRDLVLFESNRGAGIGHYITDLNSAGDEDGVFDATANVVRLLPAFSGYGSYEHWWSARIHSAFTTGVVRVTTLDIQPGSALQRTYRYSSNVIWSPIPSLELVAEFLYGIRVNKDEHREGASQLQVGSTFRF